MATAMTDVGGVGERFVYIAFSPVMRQLKQQIERMAKVDVPVVISGEYGSGKGRTAKLIHRLSARAHRPLLKVDCATLQSGPARNDWITGEPVTATPNLHVLGSIEGGTVLLVEVTQLPLRLQPTLVAMMNGAQSGPNSRASATPRVLATTTLALDKALAEKRLREDLYYQLSALTIHLPPLRQRREDIPLLLPHFISSAARQYDLPQRVVSADLMSACEEYFWPGNLRELESFAQRFVVMGDESLALSEIQQKTNLQYRGPNDGSSLPCTTSKTEVEHGLKTLVRTVKGEAERNAISGALEKTHWNRKEAALLLGISYRGILYKIEKYQLVPPGVEKPEMRPA